MSRNVTPRAGPREVGSRTAELSHGDSARICIWLRLICARACTCAGVAGRVQRGTRGFHGCSSVTVCVRSVDRLERVIGTRVESRSGRARAIRYTATMRPRNRVACSELLRESSLTIPITREWNKIDDLLRTTWCHPCRMSQDSQEETGTWRTLSAYYVSVYVLLI